MVENWLFCWRVVVVHTCELVEYYFNNKYCFDMDVA